VTCIKGHSANWHPDPIVTCYNGSWLGGECLPDPCFTDPPFDNVDETASLCENTTSGNTCSYVCETDYKPNGNATCLNGEWLNDTWCVHLPCVENPVGIEFMNSSSTDCAFTESGRECEIACNDGYTPMGAPPTCHIAVWNITSSYCEESPCGNFSIEHLHDSSNHSFCNSTHGSICEYTCESGYGATSEYGASSAVAECSYGHWVNASCEPLACLEDPPIFNINNNESLCENTKHSEECTLVCEEGYTRSAINVTCSFGEWSQETCDKPSSSSSDSFIPALLGSIFGLLLLLLLCCLLLFLCRAKKMPITTANTLGDVQMSIQEQHTIMI